MTVKEKIQNAMDQLAQGFQGEPVFSLHGNDQDFNLIEPCFLGNNPIDKAKFDSRHLDPNHEKGKVSISFNGQTNQITL